eukprot:TRINITY_DN850_c0_g2_i14.p1 TRINITY_DN850_c0_g2~~TRINITY_DN850_c0_g2_i14.p1  ORF type:complete len:274 (-),score=75.18 TRINITY_DN850_c0_g2_i14:141-962(-)
MAQKLISRGAEVNSEDTIGQTALFYSAREGHREVSEVLIRNKALVNKQDKRHQTPYHLAKKNNRIEVMNLLVSHGGGPAHDASIEKGKGVKKGGNKRKFDNLAEPKRYVLMMYEDGIWKHLNAEELKAFMASNAEMAKYLRDPMQVQDLKTPPAASLTNLQDHWDKAAKKIIAHLWKMSGANHFQQPVDVVALNIPDYHDVIKHPMDLGTIKNKLATCQYNNCKEFVNDVELVFSNCILYNEEASDYGALAVRFREEFRKQCQIYSMDYYMPR